MPGMECWLWLNPLLRLITEFFPIGSWLVMLLNSLSLYFTFVVAMCTPIPPVSGVVELWVDPSIPEELVGTDMIPLGTKMDFNCSAMYNLTGGNMNATCLFNYTDQGIQAVWFQEPGYCKGKYH